MTLFYDISIVTRVFLTFDNFSQKRVFSFDKKLFHRLNFQSREASKNSKEIFKVTLLGFSSGY